MKRAFILVLIIAATGCANRSTFIEPSSRADRMLFFAEQDRMGEMHPISSTTLEDKETTRVPSPALVDIDSLIHINVRKPPGTPAQDLFRGEADALAMDKASVLDLMQKLDDVIDARQNAFDAYRGGNPGDDFDKLVIDSSQMTRDFIKKFLERHPRDSDVYKAATKAVGKGGLHKLKPFLQSEIDDIQKKDELIKDRARLRSTSLVLEAFLDAPGDELTALHLKGYDNLAEGRVATRNRTGLKLSEQEREDLSRQIKATEDIARTLDSVRAKEKSLQIGVRDTLVIVAPELAKQVEEAEMIAGRLRDPQRIANMKADLQRATEMAKSQTDNLSDDMRIRLDALPATLGTVLKEEAGGLEEVLLIIANASQVEQDWDRVREAHNLEAIPDLLGRMDDLNRSINKAFIKLPGWLRDAGDISELLLSGQVAGVQGDVSEAFVSWIESSAVTETMSGAQSYYADIQKGIGVINEVGRILKIGSVDVARIAPNVPEAFHVDIEQLQDTLLDLRRVPGEDGDTILVRARLYDPGREPIEATSSFEITHYDYFARLVPSVVLVRPDEIASGADGFRFAPALGWMHHYRPRPEADSWYANFARPLQVAAGMHAIFLNFDNESGIGLGGTISFWNDRLQFGAGWNLSAESSDEGRHYFFVGSDLIGLLQAVGIGN